MLCNKNLENTIDQIHRRALRIVSNRPTLNLDQLVELDETTIIHKKIIITLLTEVLKATRGENPSFVKTILS